MNQGTMLSQEILKMLSSTKMIASPVTKTSITLDLMSPSTLCHTANTLYFTSHSLLTLSTLCHTHC